MSATLTPLLQDPEAARAEANRLIAALHAEAAGLEHTLHETFSEPDMLALAQRSADLTFAGVLLEAFASGIALSTPNPATGAYLVERINPSERLPDNTETVLVWSDSEDNLPWLGWYDGTIRRHVDAMPVENVTGWALRPGGR